MVCPKSNYYTQIHQLAESRNVFTYISYNKSLTNLVARSARVDHCGPSTQSHDKTNTDQDHK